MSDYEGLTNAQIVKKLRTHAQRLLDKQGFIMQPGDVYNTLVEVCSYHIFSIKLRSQNKQTEIRKRHLCISGKAGVGKTTCLIYFALSFFQFAGLRAPGAPFLVAPPRETLVGKYMGETALKTTARLQICTGAAVSWVSLARGEGSGRFWTPKTAPTNCWPGTPWGAGLGRGVLEGVPEGGGGRRGEAPRRAVPQGGGGLRTVGYAAQV